MQIQHYMKRLNKKKGPYIISTQEWTIIISYNTRHTTLSKKEKKKKKKKTEYLPKKSKNKKQCQDI